MLEDDLKIVIKNLLHQAHIQESEFIKLETINVVAYFRRIFPNPLTDIEVLYICKHLSKEGIRGINYIHDLERPYMTSTGFEMCENGINRDTKISIGVLPNNLRKYEEKLISMFSKISINSAKETIYNGLKSSFDSKNNILYVCGEPIFLSGRLQIRLCDFMCNYTGVKQPVKWEAIHKYFDEPLTNAMSSDEKQVQIRDVIRAVNAKVGKKVKIIDKLFIKKTKIVLRLL